MTPPADDLVVDPGEAQDAKVTSGNATYGPGLEPAGGPLEGYDPTRVLFVGLGTSAVAWYRCYLPALFMGADWIGLLGDPPKFLFQTGLVKRRTQMPDWTDYDVVVLQQPAGKRWLELVVQLQRRGTKVIYEIDDYAHAIRKMRDHDFHEMFTRERLRDMELVMRRCDALICSTEYIGRRYHRHCPNVYVCRNGIDTGRYALTRPQRKATRIGWAGGTGHDKAVAPWMPRVREVMRRHDDTAFVSLGVAYADAFMPEFPGRALSIPFAALDTYPAAMCNFDVALAPAAPGAFHKGKSDLRWVEASALGIPVIADATVYPDIEDGVTGWKVESPDELERRLELVVSEPEVASRVGQQAREHIVKTRDMRVMVRAWEACFAALLRS